MNAELVIEILLLIGAIYLVFFKSYLTEKGKSVALKEDLAKLTREVESVKDEFTREQEILKTDLQRILSNEISYRNEERNALIQFHGTINEWLYSILEVGYGNFNKTNIDSLIDARNRNASFYAKSGIAKSRIALLVDDDKLVELAGKLYLATLQFHNWTDIEFFKLQLNCESQKSLTERFMVILTDFERNKSIAQQMADDEEKLRADAKALFNNYMENRNNKCKDIYAIEYNFSCLVKEYLRK